MATKIVTKNSSTASAVPTASDLVQGELAVNVADKRLFTEDNGGAIVELGTNPSGNVTFQDNGKAIFGAGSDLQIYHDGSNSYVTDEGTGSLYIRGSSQVRVETPTGENMAIFNDNGGVSLRYNNAKKFETTSTGIDVTGTATMDGLSVNGAASISGVANANLQLASTGGNAYQLRTDVNSAYIYQANRAVPIAQFGYGGNISFYEDTGTTAKFFWDASAESLGIGTSSPTLPLSVDGDIWQGNTSGVEIGRITNAAGWYDFGGSSNVNGAQMSHASIVRFLTNGTERMRIDSSGDLLVGTTNNAVYASSSESGLVYRADFGLLGVSRQNNYSGSFNRYGTDGDIVNFRKDGTSVGSIGVALSDNLYFSGLDAGLGCGTSSIYPATTTGQPSDNDTDLGTAGTRWDDIYATNATIQTSDRNEKQDIAELSDAEQRVAVTAKGLLRKFRWKDSVAEKGDEARTHFGIIAQDLQAAFEAEGLDAGDYAMFISTTWTDEETNEEKTRMGVRYSELLAFIIAAL